MASYVFHPEASTEYLEATRYYLDQASALVAAAFLAEIEAAIRRVLLSPAAWQVVESPEIRRYFLRRFHIRFTTAGKPSRTEFLFMP